MRSSVRDVSNGLPIWRRDAKGGTRGSRRGMAADAGLVFSWLEDGGPLTALDIATGATVRTYPGSEIKPWEYSDRGKVRTRTDASGDSHWVRIAGKTVLANGDGALRAWTLDGKPLWTFQRDGLRVELPVVDGDSGTIYALLVDQLPITDSSRGAVYWGRWPSSEAVRALVALDLATGKPRWENTEVASRDTGMFDTKKKWQVHTGYGQILIAGKHLVLLGNDSISGGRAAMVASIERATGRTVHNDPKTLIKNVRQDGEIEWHSFLYQSIWRDGRVHIMGASRSSGTTPPATPSAPCLRSPGTRAACARSPPPSTS
jgi:outer membrane protein assembly factor BamB